MSTYVRKVFCHDPTIGKATWSDIELQLDIDAIVLDLGKRAVQSKGGRSVACGGAIKAKVVARVAKVLP